MNKKIEPSAVLSAIKTNGVPTTPPNPQDHVESEFGPPYEVNANGSVKINHIYWVRRYLENHTTIFESSLGDFYEYDPARGDWKKQTVETIRRRFIEALNEKATEDNLNSLRCKVNAALANSLAQLLRNLAEKCNVFSRKRGIIHVKNGMLCREGNRFVLKEFAPEFYSRNVCPYPYDPTADCPEFKNILLNPALSPDDVQIVQKWAGACLLGRNDAQRILLIIGTPNGGKGTFMNVIESVIGEQNVTELRTEHLNSRFEAYQFVGKTLLTGKDVATDFLHQKGAKNLKKLVGHDRMTAEKKGHAEHIPISGDFNVSITCNSDLNVRLQGDHGAWARRLLIVRYEKEAAKQRIANLDERLLAKEGPGILNWMVQGAAMLLEDLAASGNYRATPAQLQRVDELLNNSDSIQQFTTRWVIPAAGNVVTVKELKSSYLDFCDLNAYPPLPPSALSRQLTDAVNHHHRVSVRHDLGASKGRGFKGIILRKGLAA